MNKYSNFKESNRYELENGPLLKTRLINLLLMTDKNTLANEELFHYIEQIELQTIKDTFCELEELKKIQKHIALK